MAEVRMPKLSDSMETGAIAHWLVADQAPVAANDDIVDIETDKAVVTHQAQASGVIEIIANVSDEVTVGDVIAIIHES